MEFYSFAPNIIKVVDIIPLGRASSLFLQGILDSHSKCITIPNILIYRSIVDAGLDKEKGINSLKGLYEKATSIFDVKNEKIQEIITRDAFNKCCLEYLEEFGISAKNIFIAMHYAVARIVYPESWKEIDYIVYQTHLVGVYCLFENFLKRFQKDFPDRKVIFTVRDPRATWLSIRKRWSFSRNPFLSCNLINFYYSKLFDKRMPKNVFYIKHEDIHCEFDITIKKLLEFLDIKYEKDLEYSSFYKNPYDGSNVSDGKPCSTKGVYKCYPDKIYAQETWPEELGGSEIKFVEFISKSYMKRFDYEKYSKGKKRGGLANIFPCKSKDFLVIKKGHPLISVVYYVAKIPFIGSILIFCGFFLLYLGGYILGIIYLWRVMLGFPMRLNNRIV